MPRWKDIGRMLIADLLMCIIGVGIGKMMLGNSQSVGTYVFVVLIVLVATIFPTIGMYVELQKDNNGR